MDAITALIDAKKTQIQMISFFCNKMENASIKDKVKMSKMIGKNLAVLLDETVINRLKPKHNVENLKKYIATGGEKQKNHANCIRQTRKVKEDCTGLTKVKLTETMGVHVKLK